MSAVRAVPFYCPFCGEQDIRPDDAGSTSWRCDSCERHFDLTVTSVGSRSSSEAVARVEPRSRSEAVAQEKKRSRSEAVAQEKTDG